MKFKSLFIGLPAIVLAVASCQKPETETGDTLSVTPSETLNFKASDNDFVKLTVTTNAEDWDYTAPRWVVARRSGNTLTVNVLDNESENTNVGRIVFTAGNAEPVKINVFQDVPSADVSGDKVTLKNKSGKTAFVIKHETEATLRVSATISAPVENDIVVELTIDEEYVTEYNFYNDREAVLFPVGDVTLPSSVRLTIAAGQTESEEAEIKLDFTNIPHGSTEYVLPVFLKAVSNATVSSKSGRMNVSIIKTNPREGVKNAVFLEVNGVNPLNLLEYKLADGTYFFDALIVFAANINYDDKNDLVYLRNNPNVQALLNDTEIYLQPLRKAGIKVYLGLLGDHDPAGLAQLSEYGAEQWSIEVAAAVRQYKLDGVNLDDEYSKYPTNSKWFGSRSASAAAYLMYQLKKNMKEKCPWPTEVSAFEYGAITSAPDVTADGATHRPSEFLDYVFGNYNERPAVYSNFGDLTAKDVSGISINLAEDNRTNTTTLTPERAEKVVDDSYGWCMWYGFDPANSDSQYNNRAHSMTEFENAAQAFYSQSIQQPRNIYKKIGEGKYDPAPYPIN